jgi:hypothetical protein
MAFPAGISPRSQLFGDSGGIALWQGLSVAWSSGIPNRAYSSTDRADHRWRYAAQAAVAIDSAPAFTYRGAEAAEEERSFWRANRPRALKPGGRTE